MVDERKLEKKQQKEAKKAEKLAKLQAKLENAKQKKETTQPAPARKTGGESTRSGYDPTVVEKYWVDRWRKDESFRPERGDGTRPRYAIVMPPPNVTGSLHIGHAMMVAIEDSIVRYKRLTGHEVLYLPGLDHAGIATQNVVMKQNGPLGREEFMEAAHAWSAKYGERITEQLDRLGSSLDYGRKVFTLDPAVSRAVSVAFVRLYEKGLIYREKRIVNWCGKLRTTLSDLEVNYRDVKGGTYMEVDGGSYRFGMMYYVRYDLEDGEEREEGRRPYVVIGTTRPETILGDSALCVHPDDERFADIEGIFERGAVEDVMNAKRRGGDREEELVKEGIEKVDKMSIKDELSINEELKAERKNKYRTGQTSTTERTASRKKVFAINPLTGKRMPVIFDAQADPSFGTGMLKVTPAHDPVDFRLGKRHGLEFVRVMDDSNRIVVDSPYKGMTRFEARKRILNDLGDRLVGSEPHDQVLPICSRSGDLIEPVVRDQWWCDCRGMAEKAIEGVRNGDIRIVPKEAEAVWYRWLENIRDWCLSRQLWWGHRVPAYRAFAEDPEDFEWIVAESEADARAQAQAKGRPNITQDEDVLDTWFSSGLWPFSTLGWPDKTEDLTRYFPNALLETGADILFFWVARMVMLSYELCGSKPFDTILLHGLVRDSHGRKMSKSLGNVVDPTFVIDGISLKDITDNLAKGNLDPREHRRAADALKRDFPNGIPRCGADALRFTLLSYANGMKDINLDILRAQGYARLCNKISNAFTLLNSRYGPCDLSAFSIATAPLLPHHRWILQRLNETISEQHAAFAAYNFMAATQSIHALFLYSFCDIAIEAAKAMGPRDDGAVMRYVFSAILSIFHPFMPFITAEFHSKLFGEPVSVYPAPCLRDLSNSFADIVAVAKICRTKQVAVVSFEGHEYLSTLVKGGVTIVESPEDGAESHLVGSITYVELKEDTN